jgi:hypothetical protein
MPTVIPITVAMMPAFLSVAERVYDSEEIDELVNFVAFNPARGDLIPETGGVRKLRWRAKVKANVAARA